MRPFTNQATLSYRGMTVNSNIVSGELAESLNGTKDATGGTYRSRENNTFVINIVNDGTTQRTGLTVTDDLSAYTSAATGNTVVPFDYVDNSALYYVNGAPGGQIAVMQDDNHLVFTPVNIPAGGNATIVYEATPNEFAPLITGSVITNRAVVTDANGDQLVEMSETVVVEDSSFLDITKSLNPTVVEENGQLTYTFRIQNTGNAPATVNDQAVITDLFNPRLNDIAVTFNGQPWDATRYNYDSTTGLFQTVEGNLTVPAASFVQDPTTGAWTMVPSVSTLEVTGTV